MLGAVRHESCIPVGQQCMMRPTVYDFLRSFIQSSCFQRSKSNPQSYSTPAARVSTELLGTADLAPGSGLSVRSTGVKACEGEAVVNNRKNKVG